MNDIKNMGVPINLDTERSLIFNLNVMEKCVNKYKDMNALLNMQDLTELKWIVVQMLNEDTEMWNEENSNNQKPFLTEKQLGRYIVGIGALNEFQSKVQEALLKGLPEEQVQQVEEMAEELGKNLQAAQRKKPQK